MKLKNKEDAIFCNEVYNKVLAGYYYPADINHAYIILTGDDRPVAIQKKKQVIASYARYFFNENMNDFRTDKNVDTDPEPKSIDQTETVEPTEPVEPEQTEQTEPVENQGTKIIREEMVKEENMNKKVIVARKKRGRSAKRTNIIKDNVK